MISIDNITKVQYNDKGDTVVELLEYIIAEGKEDSKYIIFRFKNKTLQVLHSMKFLVEEFNEYDQKISEQELSLENINVLTGEDFVPEAKLSVKKECHKISYTLKEAEFDNMKFKEGVCYDFVFSNTTKENSSAQKLLKKQLALIKKIQKKNSKKKKQKVKIKQIKPLYGKWAFVLSAIFVLIGSASYITVSALVSRFIKMEENFTNGDFKYKIFDLENREVIITGVTVEKEEYHIPSNVNGYAIKRICGLTFHNNAVKSVYFEDEGDIFIESNAFYDCDNLELIYSDINLTFDNYAINECNNLLEIDAKYSTFYDNSLYGCDSLNKFFYGSSKTDYFGEIFGTANFYDEFGVIQTIPANLNEIYIRTNITDSNIDYFSNLKFEKNREILIREDEDYRQVDYKNLLETGFDFHFNDSWFSANFNDDGNLIIENIISSGFYIEFPNSYLDFKIAGVNSDLFKKINEDYVVNIENCDFDFPSGIFCVSRHLVGISLGDYTLQKDMFIGDFNLAEISFNNIDSSITSFSQVFGLKTNKDLLKYCPQMTISCLNLDDFSIFDGLNGYLVNDKII